MANLIITVIAIALVAVASLMGAYYGGSAFLNDQSAANASSILNQATQIAAAWNAYVGDNLGTAPTTMSQLTQSNYIANGGYLRVIPSVPAMPGLTSSFPIFIASATATVGSISGTHYFTYSDVGRHGTGVTAGISDPSATACIKIQKTAVGSTPATLATLAQGAIFAAGNGNGTFGCAILGASGISGGLGGATIPSGDLQAGDYVMEYLLQ